MSTLNPIAFAISMGALSISLVLSIVIPAAAKHIADAIKSLSPRSRAEP